MSNITMVFPAALLPSYTVAGVGGVPTTLTPVNGLVTVDARLIETLNDVGFTLAPGVGTTTNRPATGAVYAGMFFFDSTLGIPIWRNATNTAWVNSAGTSV
jgi:hypothetical protein